MTSTRRSLLTAVFGSGLAVGLAACGSSNNSNPLASGSSAAGGASGSASSSASSGSGSGTGTLIVGSANFPESALLAQIYADALTAKGVTASTKLNIGSREIYLGALNDGSIDLIPEYTGNLARYYDKQADISTPDKALAALKKALPANLTALNPSSAQDSDSICVTAATAQKYGLTSIADLAGHAQDMVLGGPPEFKQRIDGLPGLKRVYGLTFKDFKPLDAAGALTVTALKNGQVQAANLFTTDPQVKANNFVVLQDPKHLFGAQNVVPLIRKDKVTSSISSTLDAVSAKLDTSTLLSLVTKVVINKQDPGTVAKQFLASAGLS
ncbi:MAG TPA: ABC transporter substrate-binding protein [Propionibacteriaceae bacterium]|nr:ABC transporter substrate-binding protein [Propionibacteriaceae bacterium]